LLSRAGRDFVVRLATTDAYPYRQVAESVATQLRQVGIEIRLEPQPAPVLVSKYLVGKQFQLALAAFDVGPDPDQYSLWHSGAPRDSLNFASPLVPRQALIDKDLEDGRSGIDRNARRPAYADFQDLMADAAPAIFLFEPRYTYVVSKRVRGMRTNPVIQPVDRFQYVTDWYVTTRGG
jgi:peptide/nickel transport system substrate-binding protein